MSTGDSIRVVTWLHLVDREGYRDFYDDGVPLPWTREVWKSVDIGPWCYGPGSLSHSVPITEIDAKTLLQTPDTFFEDSIYTALGGKIDEFDGLPLGPYYDPVDIVYIKDKLRFALDTYEVIDPKKDIRGEIARKDAVLSLSDNLTKTLLKELRTDDKALDKISPYDFERLIAEILNANGYEAKLTPRTRDGGRDILVHKELSLKNKLLFIVECKKWNPRRKIGVGDVRRFLSTIRDYDRANKGFLITTAYFTAGARREEQQFVNLLDLRDRDELIEWLKTFGDWENTEDKFIWTPSSESLTLGKM